MTIELVERLREQGVIDAIIAATVEEAEQAARYLGKHNIDGDGGEYAEGFQAACDILGAGPTIAEHVARHKDRILGQASQPRDAEAADLLEEALKALAPFAEIAHGEVWEKFIADSKMTLRISNGGGDRHLTFVNAECFQEARAILSKSTPDSMKGE